MSTNDEWQALSLSWDIRHAPEKVWRALTEPALLARWLMATDLRAAVGERFTFRQDPSPWWDGIVRCEVLELERHGRIQYSWRSGSGASELDTVVTWTLAPTPSGGSRLALAQTGFQPKDSFAFKGARDGWECMVTTKLLPLLASAS